MSFHEEFEPNVNGNDFVVGDIHGMYSELMSELTEQGFNKDKDRLFSVGDLVDRGPDSEKVLGLIDEPWFFPVMGNHEEMMVRALKTGDANHWIMNGGGWAFKSEDGLLNAHAIVSTIETLPYAITLNHSSGHKFGICHAEPPVKDWDNIGDVESDENAKTYMVWGRSTCTGGPIPDTKNVDLTIHGHTPVNEKRLIGNALFIDLGCFHSGKIEVLHLDFAHVPASTT